MPMELLGYNIWADSLPEDIFKYRIYNTINTHSYEIAKKDMVFRSALKTSDVLLPDGVGIVLAAALLERKRINKIAGTDLHFHCLRLLDASQGSCFYLGSSVQTLELIFARIRKEYRNIRFGGMSPPFRDQFSGDENQRIIDAINTFSPDILFVGMTAPKQEKWVNENKHLVNARIVCSIGAVFDFFAGTIKRPGKFWIIAGLEFLPRFFKEPRRLWRRNLISTPRFLFELFLLRFRTNTKDENNNN